MALNSQISMCDAVNIKFLGLFNVVIGLFSFGFEVALIAVGRQSDVNSTAWSEEEKSVTSSPFVSEEIKFGTGIWCGIVFAAGGCLALICHQNDRLKRAAFLLAGVAVVLSVLQMGISSHAIGILRFKKYIWNSMFRNPSMFAMGIDANLSLILSRAIREVHTDIWLSALVLTCSLVAIPVNVAIFIRAYSQSKFTLPQVLVSCTDLDKDEEKITAN